MKTIDAKGLSCPQPVILVQQLINSGETSFEILLNSEVSKENVSRLLTKHKFNFEIRCTGEDIRIFVNK